MSSIDQEPQENEPVVEEADGIAEEDYKEKWQRAMAELENSRRRFDQEKATIRQFASQGLMEDLLPVIDNFDRATAHIPEDQRQLPWVTGVLYIQKNLGDTLERHGLQEIPAKPGDAFDPHQHEAIGTAEPGDHPEDTVVEIVAKGYKLQERIVRPVQVLVARSAN
jgi:molecular chaperone GrpE